MYKHYIKTNENNAIIKLFSNVFERPDVDSILLRESDQRHVYIGDYIFNPPLTNAQGQYLYKFVNNEVVEEESEQVKTREEKISEINEQIVQEIRKLYDANKEFQMLRLGLTDNNNAEYLTYKSYVEECVKQGKIKKTELQKET